MVQALPIGRVSGHNLGGRSCDRSSRCDNLEALKHWLLSDRYAGAVCLVVMGLGIDTVPLAGAAT